MPLISPGIIQEYVIVRAPIEEVYDFMADFSNAEKWDPGVIRSISKGNNSFELTTVFKGKKSIMTYTVISYKRPYEIILKGNGPNVRAIDTIKFSKVDANHTKIKYKADLTLKGFRRPFIIFLNKSLEQLGKDAINGIWNYFLHGNKYNI